MKLPGSIHEPGEFRNVFVGAGRLQPGIAGLAGVPALALYFRNLYRPMSRRPSSSSRTARRFFPAIWISPRVIQPVGAGYAEQRAAVAFDAAGFFAVGGGFESGRIYLGRLRHL